MAAYSLKNPARPVRTFKCKRCDSPVLMYGLFFNCPKCGQVHETDPFMGLIAIESKNIFVGLSDALRPS